MPGHIVVGIGGDGAGTEAARFAASIAEPMGAAVVLVFGYEASPLGPRGGPLEDGIEAVGDEATTTVRGELEDEFPTLTVATELVRMRPVDALIAAADEHDALAIAVGHGGSGPARAALLGSITYEVVHRAPRPVFVVPEAEHDADTDD